MQTRVTREVCLTVQSLQMDTVTENTSCHCVWFDVRQEMQASVLTLNAVELDLHH